MVRGVAWRLARARVALAARGTQFFAGRAQFGAGAVPRGARVACVKL